MIFMLVIEAKPFLLSDSAKKVTPLHGDVYTET